jgi:hypothetical protein
LLLGGCGVIFLLRQGGLRRGGGEDHRYCA